MDPLEAFGEDIAPLILQHLSVRDALNCSLVSRLWYEMIAKTNAPKMWLRFYEPLGDIECLLNSKRKYASFKIQRGLPAQLQPVFERFKWRHVMMRDDNQMNYDELVKFLRHLSPTVESLDLWDIGTACAPEELTRIDFPRLKQLEMNLTTRAVFTLFLGRSERLSEATFRDAGATFKHAEQELMQPSNTIHEFLMRNRVERLRLLHCEWTFENDLTQGVSANLNRLSLTVTRRGCTANMQANVCKFIRARPIKNATATKEFEGDRTKYLTIYY